MARRYAGNPNPLVEMGGLAIDLAARSIHRAGRRVALTAREWALFEALMQRPRMHLSKAPATANHFLARLDAVKSSLPVAVLGFGDRSFPCFCQFAEDVAGALADVDMEERF